MKLKKIASLMLAGIMAVSMLAACGEGNGNSSSSSSSSQPTVQNSAIAEALNDELSAKQAALLSFSSNAKLASLLNRIATDDEDFEQWDALISAAARPHRITGADVAYFADVAAIVNAAYNGSTPAVEFTNTTGTNTIGNIPTGHNNNRTYLYIYTVDGSMTEVSEIAAAVMNGVGGNGLQDLVYDTVGVVNAGPAGNNTSIDFEYDGYAEMVKVTNDNSSDTAYIVAVLVEQHAVANT